MECDRIQGTGHTDPTAQRRRHGAARALQTAPFSTKALCMGLGLLPEVHLLCLYKQGHWHPECPFCLQGWGLWGLREPGFSPTLPLRLTCTVTRGWGVRVREECPRPHGGSTQGGSPRGRGAGAAAAGWGGLGLEGTPLLGAAPQRASLRAGLLRTRVLSHSGDGGRSRSQGTRRHGQG